MHLADIHIPFTKLNDRILDLSSKTAVLEAIRLYGRDYVESPSERKPYQRRKRQEALSELDSRDLFPEFDDENHAIVPLEHRVYIPSRNIPYGTMTLAELKVIIALHRLSLRKRKPFFTYLGTQETLAEKAHLGRKAVIVALRKLKAGGLVRIVKERAKGKKGIVGSKIIILDPTSGASLSDLYYFFKVHKLDRQAPMERYKIGLHGWDPRDQLKTMISSNGHKVRCPFCRKNDATLRFTCNATEDSWKCFGCDRHGDSANLMSRLQWRAYKDKQALIEPTLAAFREAGGQPGELEEYLEAQNMEQQTTQVIAGNAVAEEVDAVYKGVTDGTISY
ncbi:MAG TPA: CHC2 zinc finger domain-containing protein [Acidobacteriaceae bacterium]|nr:CHC2 zinc finger domain-containing protein [Acidobacteriaceae bacterium]